MSFEKLMKYKCTVSIVTRVTPTSAPYLVKKFNPNSYNVIALCSICKYSKSKFLRPTEIPYELTTLESRETYLNFIPYKNEMISLEKIITL